MISSAVSEVLEHLQRDFPDSDVRFESDGSGGGVVIVEPVDLGSGYTPEKTWIGAQLTNGLPYADIYPLFISPEVARRDGQPHQNPITTGHTFAGGPAIQISKRCNNHVATSEAAALKFTKVIHFIREMSR